MARLIVNFANLLLASLIVGTMFGIWLGKNPVDLSPSAYVQQQQHTIRAMNITMPMLGRILALITLSAATLARSNRRRLAIFVVALICFITAGLITRFLNQPINAIVMTWSAEAPPANWMDLRDEWWRWHILRTVFGIVGMSLLIVANLIRDADGPLPGKS